MKKLLILSSILVVAGLVQAQSVPDLVNYQGRLTDAAGDPLGTGDYALRFEVYDDPVDTSPTARVWGPLCFDKETSETLSPGHKYKVPVVQGYFNVVLDQDTGYADCADTPPDEGEAPITEAFTGAPRYMEIAVWTSIPDPPYYEWQSILPRQQVLSAPYAVQAEQAFHSVEAAHSHEVACDESSTTLSVTNTALEEVDVLTLDVAGAETTGTATVNDDLIVGGDLEVSGDLVAGDGAIRGLFLTPQVLLTANRTYQMAHLALYSSGTSMCFFQRIHAEDQNYNGEYSRCDIVPFPNLSDNNALWWTLMAHGNDAIAVCEAGCLRWDCGPGTCTPAQRGLCSRTYPTCGGFCPSGQTCTQVTSACECQVDP